MENDVQLAGKNKEDPDVAVGKAGSEKRMTSFKKATEAREDVLKGDLSLRVNGAGKLQRIE